MNEARMSEHALVHVVRIDADDGEPALEQRPRGAARCGRERTVLHGRKTLSESRRRSEHRCEDNDGLELRDLVPAALKLTA